MVKKADGKAMTEAEGTDYDAADREVTNASTAKSHGGPMSAPKGKTIP